ncbi:unnamed protein product [Polarella glacialis]|uniref:Uncharacterized protein n=1 Tax=Polarella glacialis TaxID=89957 RepID=A0A813JHL6_POLGL|nr:unnamed protein product [Polarella glacialis]
MVRPPAQAEEPEQPEVGDESVFYVSQKALLVVKLKLENGEEIDQTLLDSFAHPGEFPDEEILVPIDMSALDADFPPEEEELIDEDSRLDVERMVAKLGAKGTAEALIRAQKLFLENRTGESAAERPKPMTGKEWKEIWGNDGFEEGEEEEMSEDGLVEAGSEEEDDDGEEDDDAEGEPAAKKAKTG